MAAASIPQQHSLGIDAKDCIWVPLHLRDMHGLQLLFYTSPKALSKHDSPIAHIPRGN